LDRLKGVDLGKLEEVCSAVLKKIRLAVVRFAEEGQRSFHPLPYESEEAVVRVISSLAEGADRIVARAGVEEGYELQCSLPFEREEYEKDFPHSVKEFRGLLESDAAHAVCFELDGRREAEDEAYMEAGRTVVNQSDLLIAIWDGERDRSEAGTFHRIREALGFRIPVVWIDARKEHGVKLLREVDNLPKSDGEEPDEKFQTELANVLQEVVDRLLAPPGKKRSGDGNGDEDLRAKFLRERQPGWNVAVLWKVFRDLASGEPGALLGRVLEVKVGDFEQSIEGEWQDGNPVDGWVNPLLRGYYAWADKLADYYADWYRSSFLLTYLLGAAAVFFAMFPWVIRGTFGGSELLEWVCKALEFVSIACITLLVAFNLQGRWHLCWIDYRLVAELVRQLRFLAPLGGPKPVFRVATQEAWAGSYGDPAETWMVWYVRAIEREIGLPNAKVTREYLRNYIQFFKRRLTENQLKFHGRNEKRNHRIDHHLHSIGKWLFILTFAAVIVHAGALIWPHVAHEQDRLCDVVGIWSIFCAAVLPALGSAVWAIRNQGEFLRLVRRSRAMMESFERVNERLKKLEAEGHELRSEAVADVVFEVAQLMVNESLDWRVVFKERRLEL
jgi:hypothetical protein